MLTLCNRHMEDMLINTISYDIVISTRPQKRKSGRQYVTPFNFRQYRSHDAMKYRPINIPQYIVDGRRPQVSFII